MKSKGFFKECLQLMLWLLAVVLSPTAHAQGTLTNGGNHDGAISVAGETNSWTFMANTGDTIVLRCGELSGTTTFGPMIRLYRPDSTLVSSNSHASDAYLAYQATNSGTFTVSVASGVAGQTGAYRLRLLQIPRAFTVPAGDEGGALTNGGNHDGTNSLGDEDIWTFAANVGESIVLRCAETSGTSSYSPWLRLYGPNGALLTSATHSADATIEYQATNSGTFTVLMGSFFFGHSGSYRLRFMQIPGPFIVPPGDEGGSMTNGGFYTGTIPPGDEDIWIFTANAGDNVVLRCPGTSSGSWPRVTLYGPNGALLASAFNLSTDAMISLRLTTSGTFTVLVDSASTASMGSYVLRLVKIPGPFVIPPGDEGGALTNGAAHDGVIDLGDMDLWTIPANKGDTLAFRCVKLTSQSGFYANQRLYGPDGRLLMDYIYNSLDNFFTYRTTNGGTFTLLVDSTYGGYSGSYRLRVAQVPRAFVVPVGDEGGVLTNGVGQDAALQVGDMDLWTFTANTGDSITVTLTNISGNLYHDPRIYLYKPDGSRLFGVPNTAVLVSNTAPSLGTYTVLVTTDSPGGAGSYRVRVDKFPPDFSPLTLGTAVTNRFISSGDRAYYVVTVQPGGHLRLTLDDLDNLGANEIYIRRGAPPSTGVYDYRFLAKGADQQVLAPDVSGGDWYVLVAGADVTGSGHYTLRVDIVTGLVLQSLSPNRIGNLIPASITVEGGGFAGTVQAFLKLGASTVRTGAVSVVSGGRLLADFDFVGVSSNVYQLTIAQGTNSASLPLTVINGGVPHLETQLIVPRGVGRHAQATLFVEYANTGDGAMAAPLLIVHGSDKALLTLDSSLGAEGLWTATKPRGFSDTVQFLGSGTTPGILQPGERRRLPIFFSGLQLPWDFQDMSVQFELRVFDSSNTSPVNWASYKDDLRPQSIGSDAWDVIWANFVAAAGPTWGDYAGMLSDNATYLGKLGLNVVDVSDLFAFEIVQADGLAPISALSSVTDAFSRQPGLSLGFGRFFPQAISRRFRLGPLGRGWSHNWEFRLQKDSVGNVIVLGPGGARRVFQPDVRGSFFNQPGDYGKLRDLGGGSYELRETDARKTVFRGDGLLDYVEDLNGNRITATYAGGLLATLTHSAGQSLQFAYSGGLLHSVTDPFGRVTTFGYDGAQHLTSATYLGTNTVSYAYSNGQGAAREHALTTVTYPGDTQDTFTYDALGRLLTMSRGCCAQPITFTHDSAGGVFITDALTNQSKFFFEHHGLLARAEDPHRNAARFAFDKDFNLTSLQGPDGRTFTLTFDPRGDVIRILNPLGQSLSMTYTNNDRLARLTDARSQATAFNYDAKGNVTNLVYPDISREIYGVNSQGEVLTRKNRRGQTITLSRDAAGRITRKVTPEGRTNDFSYDAHGNLTNVTDSVLGTTRFSYDHRDLLVALTHPDGRGFIFEYDALGRRTRRTSHDGYVLKYFYDGVGQLERLEDGTGRQIIQYQYDATGRLDRENRGNGTWTTYEYDATGQVLHLVNYATNGTVVSRFDYTYDLNGNRVSMTALAGTTRYTYDAVGQLTRVTYPNARQVTYEYDASGNRLRVTDNGTNTLYVANNLNQYTQLGDTHFSYDADGNLTSRTDATGTTSCLYDSENRLVSVSTPTNGTWQYTYDSFGNRVSITHNGQTTHLLQDPIGLMNVAAEYDGGGALIARYDHGLGLIDRVALNGAAYYNYDAMGHARELIGPDGSVANRYDYDPFGMPLAKEETIPNPFTYVGRLGVRSEGDELLFMRARAYSPELGAFLSVDPVMFADSMANAYRYAEANPVVFSDPSGQYPVLHILEKLLHWAHNLHLAYEIIHELTELLGESDDERIERMTVNTCETALLTRKYRGQELGPSNLDVRIWIQACQMYLLKYANKLEAEGKDYRLPPPWPEPPAPPQPPADTATSSQSDTVQSADPNELIGPAGYGLANYVRGDGAFAYRINFENATNASAPAQVVVITNTLATNLDLATLEFTSVGFGDYFFPVPVASQHYEHTEQVSYNDSVFNVNIELKVDSSTRQVQARFESVMPDTGLPPTVDVGFLPPEDGTFRGRGHVAYLIRPQPGLPTGSEIRNIGFITFDPLAGGATFRTDLVNPTDPNSGVDTNRQALVTLDADGPASSVTTLPASSGSPNFTVMWSGADSGAGISGYDIYVRTDGGVWTRWLANVPDTSALWPGQYGHTYGFMSVARDGAGNVEAAPTPGTLPDAQTLVQPQSPDRLQLLTAGPTNANLMFLSQPGSIWNLQRSLKVIGPWTNIGTFLVDTNGVGTFLETNPPAGAAFYRGLRQ